VIKVRQYNKSDARRKFLGSYCPVIHADDIFVHAALAANLTRLVSGDEDLLCLNPIGALQIITPRAALAEIVLKK
jgi:hypothetical protein